MGRFLYTIKDLFTARDLSAEIHDDWILVDNKLPAIRGYYELSSQHENSITIRLDIEVAFEDGEPIIECFSGVGEDEMSAV